MHCGLHEVKKLIFTLDSIVQETMNTNMYARQTYNQTTPGNAELLCRNAKFLLINGDMSLENLQPGNMKEDKETKRPPVTFNDLLVFVAEQEDRDAFVRLFEHFAPRIKSYLMKGGISPEEADELAQETMLSVWDKAKSYDPGQAQASTWIFTIARNKKIDALRKKKRVEFDPKDPVFIADHKESPHDSVYRHEQKTKLIKEINLLPEDQASIIKKAFFENKTHNEIAKETALPLGTVKSRIRIALEKLRHAIGAGNYE
jgi:RNA polymerase sigma-70 factor (ECF subfamily)